MTETGTLAVIFLVIATSSHVAQVVALARARARPHLDTAQQRRLVRTVGSRVAGDVLYVVLGVVALVATPVTAGVALAVFAAIKLLWLLNTWGDMRMRRSGARGDREHTFGHGRHAALRGLKNL